ncbi:MAG: DUF742 domain-containing protein [Pseudonocardiaceae bacterium]
MTAVNRFDGAAHNHNRPGGAAHAHNRPGGAGEYGWCEERVVPAYAFTQGRTHGAGRDLPLEALVTATELAVEYLPTLIMERRAIVRMSMRPTSVVEIGAALGVPAGVARVLVSDLAGAGLLTVHLPADTDGGPGEEMLGRLLNGLRSRSGAASG